MSGNTTISWTDKTWNPIVGCSIISPGCKLCYAMTWAAARLDGSKTAPHYAGTTRYVNGHPVWTGKIAKAPDKILLAPLRWKGHCMCFVNSMGDLFHEDVPTEWIDQCFAIMAYTKHTYQILTKREGRMFQYLSDPLKERRWAHWTKKLIRGATAVPGDGWWGKYSQHIWVGVSAEDQEHADRRIRVLRETPACVRFVSVEPQLERINLAHHLRGLGWVICGGESGAKARTFQYSWAAELIDQCQSADVPIFVKQMGQNPVDDLGYAAISHNVKLKNRKGEDPAEWPEQLRVREFPKRPGQLF